jgi:hypothetical protein
MPDDREARKRPGRWSKGFGGAREGVSREALEREAAAEMGLNAGGGPGEEDEPPEGPPRSRPPAPAQRARRQWSRLREVLATESDAARRERLEREAAEEMRFDSRRPHLDDD